MKNKIFILILLAVATLQACREDSTYLVDPRSDISVEINYSSAFKTFWSAMNNNYAFWSVDTTDWDAVYTRYLPQFKALDADTLKANADANLNKSYKLYDEMTNGLIDHHYALTFYDQSGKGVYACQPGFSEIKTRPYYHEDSITNHQVDQLNQYYSSRLQKVQEANKDTCCISAVVDNNIVYFYFQKFAITGYHGTNVIDKAYKNYIDLLNEWPDVKGVIIDVRGNGGGDTGNLKLILGPFVTKETVFAYSRTKDGPGRLDYGPWSPCYILPYEMKRKLNVPVVVLADIHSVSMSEFTCMAVKTLPQGISMGERTFGGHGTLTRSNDAFNLTTAGYVKNGKFEMYTPHHETKGLDGVIREGKGITPDVEVLFDGTKYMAGNDTQLEAAVKYIKSK